jgi:hypothetical protein
MRHGFLAKAQLTQFGCSRSPSYTSIEIIYLNRDEASKDKIEE